MKRNKYLLLLLNLILLGASGQDSIPGLFSDLYYNEYFVNVDFELNKNTLIYRYKFDKEVVYPSKASLQTNSQSVTYPDYNIENIVLKAEVLRPKKNGNFKTEEIKEVFKKNISSRGIFYDDVVKQTFYFPDLKEGSKSRLHFSYTGTDPELLSRLLFNFEIPVKNIRYKISVPDYLKIKIVFCGDSSKIQHQITRQDNKTIHSFYAPDREAIISENRSEDISYYTPHVFIVPISYEVNAKEVKIIGSTKNLFEYYNKHIKEIKEQDDSNLFKVVDSLVANETDELNRVKILYSWVQKNIKYVAFEEGKNGYVPRPASKTLLNKYGDCKDKANILITMLNRAKVKSYYTWIGTRNKPYTFEQLPSPYANDHMIAAFMYKDKWYYLDATAMHLEYNYPSAFIQGKEALIRLNDSNYTVQKVPVMLAQHSVKIDSLVLNTEKDEVKGTGIRKTSGYLQENYYNILSNSLKEVNSLKDEIEIGNNKLAVTDFKIVNTVSDGIKLDYKFSIPNYLQNFNDETYINLNLIKDLNNEIIDLKERKLDITEDFKYELIQNIQLTIPENKTFHEIPKNESYYSDNFSFEIKYSKNNNHITYDKRITINNILLKKEEFVKWNEMIGKLSKTYSEAIIIKSKK